MTGPAFHPTIEAAPPAAGLGQLIADRYEVLRQLGAGGMGEVFRVRDCELDDEVALKLLRADLALDEVALVRFRREVKLARRVTHPNVARTFDLGRHGGLHFLTMELIDGESLRRRLLSPISLAEVLRIAAEASRGLAAAHSKGVVHRDFKPENVMLAEGRVVITDFGIARSEDDPRSTSAGVIGTPAYMAPEQVEGLAADGRADVYALGLVLFELLTGSPAFPGATALAVMASRLTTPPPDPRILAPHVPDGVAKLVLGALARHREARPGAATLADRLDGLRGAGPSATPLSAPPTYSMDLDFARLRGQRLSIVPFDPSPGAEAMAADLTRAIRDTLSSVPRAQLVSGDSDLTLTGEVRVAGDRVRVRVRLLNRGGEAVWTGRNDGTLAEPFALEDELAAQVRSNLARRIGGRAPRQDALSSRFLKATTRLDSMDPRSIDDAIQRLEDLHREDAGDALIGSSLSLALLRKSAPMSQVDGALLARAEELALRARDADSSLAEPYHAIGIVRSYLDDQRAALGAEREALARNPFLADAHAAVGRILCTTGRAVEGIQRLDFAARLAPESVSIALQRIRPLTLVGDRARADAAWRALVARGERGSLIGVEVLLSLWWEDPSMAASTADFLEHNARGASWEQSIPFLRRVATGAPWGDLPDRFLDKMRTEHPPQRQAESVGMALVEVFAAAGRAAEALTELEALTQLRSFVDLLWLDGCPLLESVRGDARFAEVRAIMAARASEILARPGA